MDTHIQGPIQAKSLGAVPCIRGYQFNFNDTFPRTLCKIKATVKDPVFVEIFVDVLEAFDAGTTNEINVTTDGNVLLINNGAVDETVTAIQGYIPILFRVDGDINLNYTQTGTPATTGKGIVIIRSSGLGLGGELKLQ